MISLPFFLLLLPRYFTKVDKLWGHEIWLVNNEKYCAKFLILKPGYQCSLHAHRIKDETFAVIKGEVNLEYNDKTIELIAPASFRIKPGRYHRFSSPEGALILEASTTHDDDDVIRKEPSRKI